MSAMQFRALPSSKVVAPLHTVRSIWTVRAASVLLAAAEPDTQIKLILHASGFNRAG